MLLLSGNSNKLKLLYIQLFVAVIAFSIAAWIIPSYLKHYILSRLQIELYPWTKIFFNPGPSKLLNYVFLSSAAALSYLFLSSERINWILRANLARVNPGGSLFFIALNITALALSDCRGFAWIPAVLFPSVVVSLLYALWPFKPADEKAGCRVPGDKASGQFQPLRSIDSFKERLPHNKSAVIFCCVLSGVFLLFCYEVLSVIKGPVCLMNEYQNIYTDTILPGKIVNNRAYLSLQASRQDADFRARNLLEYVHQNMTRGQIDHISYILNPVNEYLSGKPAREIYFQYGTGNTVFFSWIMRVFGGVSIHNYYKCYIFYFLYSVVFLIMLLYIFREFASWSGAYAVHLLAFFSMGFNCFILAPGIIPSIHFFDAAVICLLYKYFRDKEKKVVYFCLLLLGTAIAFNGKFGGALTAASFFSLFYFSGENPADRRKKKFLILSSVICGCLIAVYYLLNHHGSTDPFLKYYLLGLYSFRPPQGIIAFTFIYLIISYFVIYALKKDRSPDKYLFVFLSVYVQFLLLYFYWSGLMNHFPMVLQFVGVQFFLMMRIFHNKAPGVHTRRLLRGLQGILAALAIIAAVFFAGRYYFDGRISGKKTFYDNFRQHRLYNWDFSRAKLISTIPENTIEQSVSLIKKYSPPPASGIYIISKYDNLLPFLSDHYSLMPYFCMSAYLLTEKSSADAIGSIVDNDPRYIYVDTDIETAIADDPWSALFSEQWIEAERASRFGRYDELRRIFDSVKDKYVKVESSGLLSVYKRKAVTQ